MEATLKQLIIARLDAVAGDVKWVWYILAACEGRDDLEKQLGGAGRPKPPTGKTPQEGAAAPEPPGAYVRSITVEGFRGIGDRATIGITPGPGLTIVIGRNGSGKSSFAEAIELLMTGKNRRWDGRPPAWRDGWRNLHHPTSTIAAEFIVEGKGTSTVTRTWKADAELDAGVATWQPHGGTRQALATLGWDAALSAYRPFLPYSELGDLLTDKPAALHDALSKVLGLEDLTDTQKLLQEQRLSRQHFIDEVTGQLDPLLTRIQQVVDETGDGRAQVCLKALATKQWDLASAKAAVKIAGATTADPIVNLLRQGLAIQVPSASHADYAARELLAAAKAVDAVRETDAGRAMETASLLEQALKVHTHAKGTDCPVCGSADALTPAWHARTSKEIERLRTAAKEAAKAHERLNEARRAAERLLTAPSAVLRRIAKENIPDAPEALEAWEAWHAGPGTETIEALAKHLQESCALLHDAMKALVESVEREVKRRDDRWLPVAQDVRTWLDDAERVPGAREQLNDLKKAEQWFKEAQAHLRAERFRPIADRARAVWAQLRQNSNVELDDVQLTGSATQRRVALDVTVDGVKGAALGVMSQGELNALALSLFMPRASLPESPFRFMVIDDPVQSMDPSRIDGLAQALSNAARTRQVIVFTHDERLPAATRYLGLPATVIEVTRKDGHAVVKTPEMPDFVKGRVVPGLCRSAIEAACMHCVRVRRLKRGESHEVIEELLLDQKGLASLVALALFDDEERGGEVTESLKNRWKSGAAEAFRACNTGSHDGYDGDLEELLRQTKLLARGIQEVQ